jgi:hypothetical protein
MSGWGIYYLLPNPGLKTKAINKILMVNCSYREGLGNYLRKRLKLRARLNAKQSFVNTPT